MNEERPSLDFTIDKIINAVIISTQKDWLLNNLCYADRWILCYSLSGEATYRMDNQERVIKKGDIMFIPPGKSRSAQTNTHNLWKFIVIKFCLSNFQQGSMELLESIPSFLTVSNPITVQWFKEIEINWRFKHTGYLIKCKGLLYNLLFQLLGQSDIVLQQNQYSALLSQVLEMIGENLKGNYSVDFLASVAGLSSSYFRAIFKKYTGYTPTKYQNYLKMHHAYDLLCCEHYSISEVAEKVGMDDCYYFSKLFKQVIGISPSKVRG
jgi:AraC-like DNA-binding protein